MSVVLYVDGAANQRIPTHTAPASGGTTVTVNVVGIQNNYSERSVGAGRLGGLDAALYRGLVASDIEDQLRPVRVPSYVSRGNRTIQAARKR